MTLTEKIIDMFIAAATKHYEEHGNVDTFSFSKEYKGTNVKARNGTLLSYGSHFHLCSPFVAYNHWCEEKSLVFVVNGDYYSTTTSRHQNDTLACLRAAKAKYITVALSALKSAVSEEPSRSAQFPESITLHDYTTDQSKHYDRVKGDEALEAQRAYALSEMPIGATLSSHIYKDGDGVMFGSYGWHRPGHSLWTFTATCHTYSNPYSRSKTILMGMDEGSYFSVIMGEQALTLTSALRYLRPLALTTLGDEEYQRDVKRQGEWFFYPVRLACGGRVNTLSLVERLQKAGLKSKALPMDNERSNPHKVLRMLMRDNGEMGAVLEVTPLQFNTGNVNGPVAIALGTVKHRQHKTLVLDEPCFVYKNRAVMSFGSAGNVD